VAWVTLPASHPPHFASIPTTCPNSLLCLNFNAQLMGVVYTKHGQAAGGLGLLAGGLGKVVGGLGHVAC
jgi:hypothetical protein